MDTNIETFESPLLADVQINPDGTLKQSGKQNVRFYNKKRLAFKARPLYVKDDEGNKILDAKGRPVQAKDKDGKPLFEIDPKTGIPFKDAYEEIVEMIRVETRGDTNIKEDVADHFAKRQFHRQYKYFREGKIPEGHSIEDFEFLQPQTILELHMFGIHTLEQLAEMDEVLCEQIKDQSGFEIRDIARQWLKINSAGNQSSKADRLELENARIKREIESLKAQLKGDSRAKVMAAFSSSEVVPDEAPEVTTMELSPEMIKRGPGRPKKVEA